MIIYSVFKLFKTRIRNAFLYFEGLSLIKKFFIAYLVVFTIPVFFFGWLYTSHLRKSAEEELLNRSIQDIRQVYSDVTKNIDMCKSTVDIAISTKGLLRTLAESEDITIDERLYFRDYVLPNLENIVNINTSINKLRIFVQNENIFEIYPCIRFESLISNEKWYKNIYQDNDSVYWRLNHKEDSFDQGSIYNGEYVSFYREVMYNNKHVGIQEVSMYADVFYGHVYTDIENETQFVSIIKDKSDMYWNTKSKFVRKYEFNPMDIKEQLITNSKGNEGNFKIKASLMDLCVTYRYIAPLDAYIYQVVSLKKIREDYRNVQITAALVILLTLGIFSLVTYMITSALLKKMQTIVSFMRRVQQGEMFVDIPVHGNDEIGELSRHFSIMLNRINELIFTVVKKQASTKDAEIRALHSQINAHFIYNVLEAVKMMAVIDNKYEIADSLTALGRLMRYSMNWKKKYVFLDDEVRHIKNYIRLLNLRFNNTITLEVDIPEILLNHEILKMILQPIVENSINHGLEPKGNGGVIRIRSFVKNDIMHIEIRDDGVGMNEQSVDKLRSTFEGGADAEPQSGSGNGIGLVNVNERIKLFYGSAYGLYVESKEQEYTVVGIKLPYLLSKDKVVEGLEQ